MVDTFGVDMSHYNYFLLLVISADTARKGAVSYGTLKIVDFEKIWHIKVTVIPQDLMLLSKSCFCIWFENLHFCWKKIWSTNSSALPNI